MDISDEAVKFIKNNKELLVNDLRILVSIRQLICHFRFLWLVHQEQGKPNFREVLLKV